MDSAMDLSLRNSTSPSTLVVSPAMKSPSSTANLPVPNSSGVRIVRPIPRPPWSIVWYQNLWSVSSTSDQYASKSESGENSKTKPMLCTNERSSFSVLNNLSINTVNSCVSASNFPYTTQDDQNQHSVVPFSTDKFYTSKPVNEPVQLATLKPLFEQDKFTGPTFSYESHFNDQDSCQNEYITEGESDSDNSENIVVTTSPRFSTGIERAGLKQSPASCSLDKSELSDSILRVRQHQKPNQTPMVLDIACCDGPVQFKRISNPNFALTVEHNEVTTPSIQGKCFTTPFEKSVDRDEQHQQHEEHDNEMSSTLASSAVDQGNLSQPPHHSNTVDIGGADSSLTGMSADSAAIVATHKSYLCIYCNQSFKSLFCYQKHKKRHLNPVSVDITTTTANSTSYRGSSSGSGGTSTNNKKVNMGEINSGGYGSGGGGGGGVIGTIPENAKAKTKDLNVQFFPCKKCGCKFPSYYFVHKHRKICH